jgi:histidine triad (HIT) family protein
MAPADLPARMKPCPFCEIAASENAQVLLEGDGVVAFLDHAPLLPGHTLVAPREHVETLDDLPEELIAPLFRAVQRVSRAQRQGLGADGSFTGINTRVSQSVPHLHVHVVPRRNGDGLFRAGMVWRRGRYREGEAAAIAAKIRGAL